MRVSSWPSPASPRISGRQEQGVDPVALVLSLLFGVLVLGAFSLVVIGGIIEDWISKRFGFSGMMLTVFALFLRIVIVLALLLGYIAGLVILVGSEINALLEHDHREGKQ